jgi:hypothetical protein
MAIKPSVLAATKELKKRKSYQPKPIELDPLFPKQNAFIEDTSRYLTAQCSRRAGKTNGLAIRFFKTLAKYPKSQCVYLSLTRDSAFEIMWPVLLEINEKYGLGCTFTESNLTMKHPNGSKLKLMGADMKNFIKRLKGRKYPGIGVDEAQDFGPHLQSLIDDVLTPSISDYVDGWIAITGTPGPVPKGYFFDITQNNRFGYSKHTWTLLDNPYMPNPAQFIEDLKIKREWSDSNPTLLREWRNVWVLDTDSLWIRYRDEVNNFNELPTNLDRMRWHYILGIDLGFRDADALAVLAWHEDSPQTYLVEEVITAKQGITELVNQVETITKKYNFDKMVIDEGGLGKKIAEEIRRQKHIPVQQADKALKQQNVEFLNDALRLGRFKAKSSSRFAQDSYLVQIDWDKSRPDKIVIKKHPHSDIIDAVLYAFKESPAFTYQAPKNKPHYGTKEWADAQQDEMFENAQEHFAKQADIMKNMDNGGWPD